jgi:hypothetical protein
VYGNSDERNEARPPYPALRTLLKNKSAGAPLCGFGVALIDCWTAYRTGIPDFYVLAAVLGGAAYLGSRIAIEVLELISETLMPR